MSERDFSRESWTDSRGSSHCTLCSPREPNNEHRLEIASLSISTLYLFRDQRFRGSSLLTFDRRHATALEDLSEDEYRGFVHDLWQAAKAIRSALNSDHMNHEYLGNTSPHRHWHIVPRYRHGPHWEQPIWEGWPRNEFSTNRFVLPEREYVEIIERIHGKLQDATRDELLSLARFDMAARFRRMTRCITRIRQLQIHRVIPASHTGLQHSKPR
jgi:diadenosine tetraphosphate (Ap4A) HIT family hydrolase